MTVEVHRDGNHPWTGMPGWDRMVLTAATTDELHALIKAGERKLWSIWLSEPKKLRALMFKPSGASAPWKDEPRMGANADVCLSVKAGDMVYTDFSGRVTKHKVVARKEHTNCQMGVMLQVSPVPPGASTVPLDHEHNYRNLPWLSCAWFRPAEDEA